MDSSAVFREPAGLHGRDAGPWTDWCGSPFQSGDHRDRLHDDADHGRHADGDGSRTDTRLHYRGIAVTDSGTGTGGHRGLGGDKVVRSPVTRILNDEAAENQPIASGTVLAPAFTAEVTVTFAQVLHGVPEHYFGDETFERG